MQARAPRLLGALSLGGRALGSLVLVVPLLNGRGELWLFFLTAFHVFGMWAGFAAWRHQEDGARWQALFWLIQVPLVLSPSFSYLLSAGAGAWLYAGSQFAMGWSFTSAVGSRSAQGKPAPDSSLASTHLLQRWWYCQLRAVDAPL
jgi:hypothetical protein